MNSGTQLPLSEALLRERAYYLWLERGKPHGRDLEIWLDAQAVMLAEQRMASGDDFSPPHKSAPRKTRPRDRRPDVARSGAAQRRRARRFPTTQSPPEE